MAFSSNHNYRLFWLTVLVWQDAFQTSVSWNTPWSSADVNCREALEGILYSEST